METPPRRVVSAWMVSCGMHLVFFVTVSLVAPAGPQGVSLEPDRGAGIVIVEATPEGPKYRDESVAAEDSAVAERGERDVNAGLTALPSAAAMPLDIGGLLPSGADAAVALPTGGTQPSAGRLTTTRANPRVGSGYKAQTELFGLSGSGTKFLYVIDRSASMSSYGGRPMRAAQKQLLASLAKLDSIHQFQIIFYNDRITVFNPNHPLPPRLLFAGESEKRQAEGFVAGVSPAGGTDHMVALKLALSLAPDVLFFLTDADEPQLSEADLVDIGRRNQGTVIHAIEFGAGPRLGGDSFLARLARQNAGQHTYVDVTALAD